MKKKFIFPILFLGLLAGGSLFPNQTQAAGCEISLGWIQDSANPNNCIQAQQCTGVSCTCPTGSAVQNGMCTIPNPNPPDTTPATTPADCAALSGQTYSSAANNGKGGCVPIPSQFDCPSGQTYSSAGGATGNGGCVTTPQAVNVNIAYVPLEPLPFVNQTGNVPFGQLVSGLFKLLIVLGGLITVGTFVFAGISYMVSDVVDRKSEAKKRLYASLWGLLLLIGAWVILFTINPQLVVFSNITSPAQGIQYLPPANDVQPGCVGTSCVSAQQQAAIDDLRKNGISGASTQDAQTAQQVAQSQAAACTTQAQGSVANQLQGVDMNATISGLDTTPCARAGYISCTQMVTGGNQWCVK